MIILPLRLPMATFVYSLHKTIRELELRGRIQILRMVGWLHAQKDIPYPFSYSLTKYLRNAYYVPGPVMGTEGRSVSKTQVPSGSKFWLCNSTILG